MPRITLDISQVDLDSLSKPNVSNLSAAQLERLAILSEEMGEAQQIIGKIIRHGYNSYNPKSTTHTSNKILLQDELGHVSYAVEMMIKAHDVDRFAIEAQQENKRSSIKPYLHFQED